MTHEEKIKVAQLQQKGWGYRRIATEIGISPYTGRSYFERHPVALDAIAEKADLCKHCGAELKHLPHKKKKVFCSQACRLAWWKAHPEQGTRNAYYSLICEHCGKEFVSYGNAHRRFCSRICYAEHRRKESTDDRK